LLSFSLVGPICDPGDRPQYKFVSRYLFCSGRPFYFEPLHHVSAFVRDFFFFESVTLSLPKSWLLSREPPSFFPFFRLCRPNQIIFGSSAGTQVEPLSRHSRWQQNSSLMLRFSFFSYSTISIRNAIRLKDENV